MIKHPAFILCLILTLSSCSSNKQSELTYFPPEYTQGYKATVAIAEGRANQIYKLMEISGYAKMIQNRDVTKNTVEMGKDFNTVPAKNKRDYLLCIKETVRAGPGYFSFVMDIDDKFSGEELNSLITLFESDIGKIIREANEKFEDAAFSPNQESVVEENRVLLGRYLKVIYGHQDWIPNYNDQVRETCNSRYL